jgi:hypothetical protein
VKWEQEPHWVAVEPEPEPHWALVDWVWEQHWAVEKQDWGQHWVQVPVLLVVVEQVWEQHWGQRERQTYGRSSFEAYWRSRESEVVGVVVESLDATREDLLEAVSDLVSFSSGDGSCCACSELSFRSTLLSLESGETHTRETFPFVQSEWTGRLSSCG